MKKRGVFIITLFLILSCIYTVSVVYSALTGSSLFEKSQEIQKIRENLLSEKIISSDKCSNKEKIDLSQSSDPHLVQLAKYQNICDSQVTEQVMIFTDMPKDNNVAIEDAKKMADTLKEFDKYNIKPIVIIEPVTDWGLIDFSEFGSGFYDNWIYTYFYQLKKEGITDEMMGLWVPFPEANLPYWNHANATPADFSAIVNRYLKAMKYYFPNTKGGILLNSATYEVDDFEWANGEYVSLLQYVEGLDKNLVDSMGMQGFPWVPSKNREEGAVLDPQEFLNSELVSEAADKLETKEIWLNTGTFATKYTLDEELLSTVNVQKRVDILDGIISESLELKKKGYDVTINIFAQDKSQVAEATNWSYLKESFGASLEDETAFIQFVNKLYKNNLQLAIFDRLD